MSAPTLDRLNRHCRKLATPRDESDGDLLSRFVAGGDDAAFAAILERHGAMVRGVCRRVLRDDHLADDAFQAVALVLARNAGRIRRHGSLASWLFGTAHRLALQMQRTRARRRRREQAAAKRVDAITAPKPWDDLLAVLDEELARLPERYRAPLIACYMDGRTQDEAARELGASLSTLRRRLDEARDLLRRRLRRRGVELSAALLTAGLVRETVAAELIQAATAAAGRFALTGAAPPSLAGFVDLASGVRTAVYSIIAATVVAGAIAAGALGGRPSPAETPPRGADDKPRAESVEAPLPDGAVARVGSTRWRPGGWVWVMSWSPDRKTLATYGHAGGLCTLDAATGKLLRRYDLGLKDYPVGDIRFTDDGKGIAVIDYLGYRVVDLATGKNAVHHPWERDMYRAFTDVFLSPDGKTFLTCDNIDLNLHRCSDRSLVWTAKVGGKWTAGAAFSPDGKRVAVPDREQALKVRDVVTGKVEFELKGDQKKIGNVVFSPDSRLLATLGWWDSREVVVWDLKSQKPLAAVPGIGMGMTRAIFSADNAMLVVAGGTDDTFVIDVKAGKIVRKFRTWPSMLSMAFASDGQTVFCGSNDGCITRWDVATGEALAGGPDPVQMFLARFAPDDKHIELRGSGTLIREWATGRTVRSISADGLTFGQAVSPDGKCRVETEKQFAVIRDAATGKEIRRLGPADVPHLWLPQFTPDGKRVIAGSPTGVIFVWDFASGEKLHRLDGKHQVVVNGYQLSPSGRLLAAFQRQTGIRGDGAVRLWDLEKGVELKRFTPSRGGVNGVTFSPDETLLVGAGTSRVPIGSPAVITVWEIATGRELRRIDGHVGEVMAVAVSPDQRLLATGGHDATVRVWELASGQERQTITAHRDQVSSVAFSSDGRLLATVSSDAPVFIWDLYRPGAKPTAADRDALWDELAKETHWAAMKRLLADPALAISLIRQRVTIPAKPDPEFVKTRLADLDSQQFATRQKALAHLEKLGAAIEPVVRAELDARPGAEKRRQLLRLLDILAAPSPDQLRMLRAVEVAERVATPAAKALLEDWSKGPAGARLTQEAAGALRRMK